MLILGSENTEIGWQTGKSKANYLIRSSYHSGDSKILLYTPRVEYPVNQPHNAEFSTSEYMQTTDFHITQLIAAMSDLLLPIPLLTTNPPNPNSFTPKISLNTPKNTQNYQ
jgi:hypothetical protein